MHWRCEAPIRPDRPGLDRSASLPQVWARSADERLLSIEEGVR